VLALICSIAGSVAAAAWPLRELVVKSASMEPTIHCSGAPGCRRFSSDRVLVQSLPITTRIRSGELVIIALRRHREACGGHLFIKRVVGLPGEMLRLVHGRLFVDGHLRLERHAWVREAARANSSFERLRAGHYFVLGDNRLVSCDSRSFGAVARSEIVGRVIAIERGHSIT
jgi:signal peptidase I